MKVSVTQHGSSFTTTVKTGWFDTYKSTYFDYNLSRVLTNTTSEGKNGIFSYGDIGFVRGDLIVVVTFEQFNWRDADIYEITAEMKNRVKMVNKAFSLASIHSIEFEV
jgi:hypothetical protein